MNGVPIKRPRLRRAARGEASSLLHSAELKKLHCPTRAVPVVVGKTLVPRLVRSHHDLSTRPLRVLVFQEPIPPQVSWISSWQPLSLLQLLTLLLLLTKSIVLLLSGAGAGMLAEDGLQGVVGSVKWGMPFRRR